MKTSRSSRSWLALALRLGATILILALLFHFLPFSQLWAAARRVPLALWLAVLGAYLCVHIFGMLKWRLMINLADAGLGSRHAARCYFGGLFGTLFLPSIVGGDVIRVGLALRGARSRAGALLGSLLDRMLDVAALATVAALGVFLLPQAPDPRSHRIFLALAAAAALGAALLAAGVALLPSRRFSYRMRRSFARLRRAARTVARRPQYVLLAWAMGVCVQSSFVLLTSLIAAGCGLHLPLRVWMFAWPLAKLSALLPITQGGIGVREVALAALTAPFGAPPAVTVAVGLVWEAIIVAGGLLAGLVSFLLGRSAARVKIEAQTEELSSPAPQRARTNASGARG